MSSVVDKTNAGGKELFGCSHQIIAVAQRAAAKIGRENLPLTQLLSTGLERSRKSNLNFVKTSQY